MPSPRYCFKNQAKLLFQNQPHLFSLSYFRSLPPDLPYHQSLTLVSSTVSPQNNMMSPSPSSPSTLTTAQSQVIKYDVFLSFRGEDTRVAFTSHLYAALNRKQILTFIDYELVRGDEISASLLRTIEEAKLSVIVFSENYASSKWCLEELAKIIERRKNNGQIVIPVFYQVDQSHVRNQTGRFGNALARLIKKKALTMDKEQSFRDALTDAANLSGWSLGKSELESEFIEKIIGDVSNELQAMSSSHTTALFGIDVHVNKVESLLKMESPDALIVGIQGMVLKIKLNPEGPRRLRKATSHQSPTSRHPPPQLPQPPAAFTLES